MIEVIGCEWVKNTSGERAEWMLRVLASGRVEVGTKLPSPTPATVATGAVAQGGGVGAGTLAKAIRRIDRRHDLSALSLAEAILAELPKANSHALLASPAVPVGDGWMPIETAPTKVTDVLLYCSDTDEQLVGFPVSKGLYQFACHNGIEIVCRPDFWQPLPPAPAATKREEGHE